MNMAYRTGPCSGSDFTLERLPSTPMLLSLTYMTHNRRYAVSFLHTGIPLGCMYVSSTNHMQSYSQKFKWTSTTGLHGTRDPKKIPVGRTLYKHPFARTTTTSTSEYYISSPAWDLCVFFGDKGTVKPVSYSHAPAVLKQTVLGIQTP